MTQAIRSFFAVPIPDQVRSKLAEVIGILSRRPNGDRVRWVSPDNLHVTLRFLGDVTPGVLADLVVAVAREVRVVPAFECRLQDVRMFPNPRRARVVAIGMEATGHLTELAAAVERGVVDSGSPPGDREFRAHLTLGRLLGHGYPSSQDDFGLADHSVCVDRVVLYQSELRPEGATYREIEAIALAGETS